MMKERPWTYIASPYTKGDPAINTHFQCRVFDRLMNGGLVWPYVPLWSHFQHTMFPRHYKDWIEYDNAIIDTLPFDACLRLNAEHFSPGYFQKESSGADDEVERFRQKGVPVFFSIEDLNRFALNWNESRRAVS